MPAQDDARENQLVDLFNLEREENRVRHGTDAVLQIDGQTIEFELKSVTTDKGGMSTVRDLGRDHIEKWRSKHWIVAFYNKSGKLIQCKYANPDDMRPWIDRIWAYIEPDFRIADVVPAQITLSQMHAIVGNKAVYSFADAKLLHKMQLRSEQYRNMMDVEGGYSPERMLEIFRDRVSYVIRRGSTLNNPHIPAGYFEHHAPIVKDHSAVLRQLIGEWLSSSSE